MTEARDEPIKPPVCNFCTHNKSILIDKALYERYSSSQNFFYSKEINQLISDDLTKAAIDFVEWQVIDDEDEFLKRQYKIAQYAGKSKSLGDYYQYHRELPRFFGLPIEIAMKRYHEKVRDHEYKVVKRMMNETEESLLDPSMIASQNSNTVSEMSNVLRLLEPQQMKVEESIAFLHVVQELKELTKKNQVGNFDIKGDFYKSHNPRSFEQYLQKIARRKRKGQISIQSVEKRHSMQRTEGLNLFEMKDIKEEEQKLIIKNYDSQSYKFKGKLSQRVDTLLNGLQKTKPLLKNTLIPQIIPRLTKVERQRSIQRIYGATDRSSYNSLSHKPSTKIITLESDRMKGGQKFRISESTKKIKDKELSEVKTIDYKSSNKLSEKGFKITSRYQDANNGINTTRRKELIVSKSILKKKSESVPNIKTAKTSRELESKNQKLDPVKIYKKMRGIV